MSSGRRWRALPAAAAVATVLAACGGASTTGGGGGGGGGGGAAPGASATGGLVVLVTPDRVGVNEFIRNAVEGIEQSATQIGGTSRVFESTDPSTMSQNLQAAIRLKPKVVVALSFQFQDLMNRLPQEYPDQQFMLVDACVEKPAKNLTCAVFREHEAVFLAGAEAGLLSKTGKVGAVVALDSPFIRRFSDPFGAGAKHVKEGTEFRAVYVGGSKPFADPARAKEQALTVAESGADYVMASAAAGNFGVFEAAKQRDFKAFGVDVNQCPTAPEVVVDNVIKRVDVAIVKGVQAITSGKPGGVQVYGLKEGGVTLTGLQDDVAQSKCLIADYPEVLAKVKALSQEIIDGSVTVADPATKS